MICSTSSTCARRNQVSQTQYVWEKGMYKNVREEVRGEIQEQYPMCRATPGRVSPFLFFRSPCPWFLVLHLEFYMKLALTAGEWRSQNRNLIKPKPREREREEWEVKQNDTKWNWKRSWGGMGMSIRKLLRYCIRFSCDFFNILCKFPEIPYWIMNVNGIVSYFKE